MHPRACCAAVWFALASAPLSALAGPSPWTARSEPPLSDEPPPIDELEPLGRSAPSLWRRPLALEAHLSLGGPFGMLGAAVDYSFSDGFSATLGGGLTHAGGGQLGSALRMRLLLTDRIAVGAQGGLAVGEHEELLDCPDERCPPDWRWDRAVWGHVGLVLEARDDRGLALRFAFGASSIFNLVDGECTRCEPADEPSMWTTTVPYAGVAIGWALSP
jgi:hypothetical protein